MPGGALAHALDSVVTLFEMGVDDARKSPAVVVSLSDRHFRGGFHHGGSEAYQRHKGVTAADNDISEYPCPSICGSL